MEGEQSGQAVTHDDFDECWCCGGLHDRRGTLCPNCDDAGCNRFTEECESDHQPALADGGSAESSRGERMNANDDRLTGGLLVAAIASSVAVAGSIAMSHPATRGGYVDVLGPLVIPATVVAWVIAVAAGVDVYLTYTKRGGSA